MRNWCQILGSDAHDNKRRNFLLKDAYELTKNMIGDYAKPLVYDNPMAVINGKSIIIEPEEKAETEEKKKKPSYDYLEETPETKTDK